MNHHDKKLIDAWHQFIAHPELGGDEICHETYLVDVFAAFDRALADHGKYEAIRQTVKCPTCDGDECFHEERIVNGDPCEVITGNCPDCTDGKIPMARLLGAGAAVFAAEFLPPSSPLLGTFSAGYTEGSNDRLLFLRAGQS